MSNINQDNSVQKIHTPATTIQRVTALSGDDETTSHQVIIDNEMFTFEHIKKQIGIALSSAPESNQQETALCMHASELMARVECLECSDMKVSEDFKLEFASAMSRLMGNA